jgi:enamine deaminase RidA (YjgF/YER057c/UK114 family)
VPEAIQPAGWPRPSGYTNGVLATGRVLAMAGQIGAQPDGALVPGGLPAQLDQALANVGEIVAAAGGRFEDVVSMTVYVISRTEYLAARPALGEIWRRRAGRHFPAMTLVEVAGLVVEGAVIELQALAVLP